MSLEAQLAAALNMSARRRAISDAGEPPTESLVLRLCEQARSRMRVDVQEASGYAAAACDIARMLRAPKPMAEALRMKGHVNYLRGRHREAARTYEKAVTIIESLGAQVDVGRTMSSALQTLIYLGRHEQALTWSHRARQIFEAEGDQLRLAPLDGNVANVFHRQERFDEALCLYQSALARLEELGDEESSAITLRNMAVSYMSVHDFSSALRANERALAFYRQRGLILLEAEVNDNYRLPSFPQRELHEGNCSLSERQPGGARKFLSRSRVEARSIRSVPGTQPLHRGGAACASSGRSFSSAG